MEYAILLVTSIHLIGLMLAIAGNLALDKCNLNQTKISVLLKSQSLLIYSNLYLVNVASRFLGESLWMKIDHLSTTLGVENDAESHCNIKYIIVPAKLANDIIPRHHAQNGVIYDLHWTTVCFRVFTNCSVIW